LLPVYVADQRLVVRVFLAHAASLRHAILFARMKFRGFLHSFNDRGRTRARESRGRLALVCSAYDFTPTLRRIVIIGHQFVKADWKRFKPTKAVKRSQ